MVQRYEPQSGMVHCDDGIYVRYPDYAALEAERDELAARLRELRGAWDMREFDTRHQVAVMDVGSVKAMNAALDGPVPECRACAEMRDDIGVVIRAADAAGYVIKGVLRGFLARHAADEGGWQT